MLFYTSNHNNKKLAALCNSFIIRKIERQMMIGSCKCSLKYCTYFCMKLSYNVMHLNILL